jgi:hypothetical protein
VTDRLVYDPVEIHLIVNQSESYPAYPVQVEKMLLAYICNYSGFCLQLKKTLLDTTNFTIDLLSTFDVIIRFIT